MSACGGATAPPVQEPDAFVRNASYDHVMADEQGMIWSIRVEPPLAVLRPDGQQVTKTEWDAFESAFGYSTCDSALETDRSGKVKVEARGLLPNAVYTVWQFEFDETRIPLGSNDGTENKLVTSAEGSGVLEVQTANCDVNRLILAYHIDGQTYSTIPGPDATWVAHAVIRF